jgi:hypothetical protein
VLHSTPLKPCADSDMLGGPGMPSTALYTVLFLLAGFSDGGWIPILSDHMATGSLQANQTRCYRFHMDDATTKQAVNWEQRRKAPTACISLLVGIVLHAVRCGRLLIRLDPCSGLPHLKVSVYGCPSEGHQVTWEYMDEVMQNDLRAAGRPVPKAWVMSYLPHRLLFGLHSSPINRV